MEYIKLLKVADVREVLDKLSREEISCIKMVELLNIKANKQLLIQRVVVRKGTLPFDPKCDDACKFYCTKGNIQYPECLK